MNLGTPFENVRHAPKSGRHLESPFGFLKTQPVLDLENLHQQIIRVAHDNAEKRQKRNRQIVDQSEANDDDDSAHENMQTTSIHSKLFKLERLSFAAVPCAESCLKTRSREVLPSASILPKIKTNMSGAVSPSLRSVSRFSVTSTRPNCFWCRKLGKWCGWCSTGQGPLNHNLASEAARNTEFSNHSERTPGFNAVGQAHPVNETSVNNREVFRRHSLNRRGSESRDKRQYLRSISSLAAPISTHSVKTAEYPTKNLHKSTDTRKARGVVFTELLKENKSILLGILQEKYLSRMAVRVRSVNYASGSVVFKQGDASDVHRVVRYSEDTDVRSVAMAPPFYLVARGVLVVSVTDEFDGSEVAVATLNVGNVFGEYSALLGCRRCCTVRAAVPCELIEVMRSHLSRAVYESMQDEMDDKEAEDERIYRERKADRLLPLKAEREMNAANEKQQVSAMFVKEIERRVFGLVLSDAQREREWSSGVHARKLRKEHQRQLYEYYAVKIQHAVAGMRARRAVQKIKRARAERLSAAIRIQRMFRGAIERSRMKQKMTTLSNQLIKGKGNAAAWTLQWLSRSRQNKEEAELDLQEKAVSEKYYRLFGDSIKLRKIDFVRKILCAMDKGTIVGMTFRCVCKDIAGPKIPAAAVRRWVYGRDVVKKEKIDESESEFDDRKKRLESRVEMAVLEWCERSSLVQNVMSEWKNDIAGYRQSEEQHHAAKRLWARFFFKGLLPDEIDAAIVIPSLQVPSSEAGLNARLGIQTVS